MFINVDMYEEVGLDPDQPPTTLDELLEHAKKLAKYDAQATASGPGTASLLGRPDGHY